MTKKTSTELDIVTAEQYASDADVRVAELRAAILSGDTSINPGALETAEAEARLAHLRVDAASRAEADRAEQARVAAIQAIRVEIEATIENPAPFLDALRQVEDGILTLIQLNEGRIERLRTWRHRLYELGVDIAPPGGGVPEPHGIAPLESAGSGRSGIRVGRGKVGAIEPHQYLKSLVTRALRDPSRQRTDLYEQLARELGHVPER